MSHFFFFFHSVVVTWMKSVHVWFVLSLSSGSSWCSWTERWRRRPRSSGEKEVMLLFWMEKNCPSLAAVAHIRGHCIGSSVTKWSSCLHRVPVVSRGLQDKLAKLARGWVNSMTCHTLTLQCVCAHMPLCLLLCGCLYLWPLLKRWEAYFQFNKQLLDMCLKACAASNPRINGRAANLSENAKMGKLATDMGHK